MTLERAVKVRKQSRVKANGLDTNFRACRSALDSADSVEAASLLNDLAEIERERQNLLKALSLAERARATEEAFGDRFTGRDAVRIRARTLQISGDIHCTQGEYSRSEGDLRSAVTLTTAVFGEASEEAAVARNNLAVLYKYWGRFDEGLKLYSEALSAVVAIHGDRSLAAAAVYHNIGGILHSKGDFAAAEAPARRAWEISRELLGECDPHCLSHAVAYASVLDGLERYQESCPIYRCALEVFEREYGPEHYEVAATLHNLAATLAARGHLEQAEQSYRSALAIKQKVLGDQSPDVALTRNNLGKLLTELGRPVEAVAQLTAVVAILEKRLLSGHPHIAKARENLRTAMIANEESLKDNRASIKRLARSKSAKIAKTAF